MPSAIARWRPVHLALALATLVGVAAGYGTAVFYSRPFDMAAAAAPKIPAVPASTPALTQVQVTQQPSPAIPVVRPKTQSVSSFVDVTGNAASVNAVKLIARIEGYLEQLHYQDGQFVKKGDLLFTIQQDQYKDQLQQSQAQVLAAQASLSYAKTEVVRYRALLKKDAATQVEVDKWVYQRAAFIPNEDQGYLMVAALLPDGAALGRSTTALDQATKLALDTPGVDRVIAISGLSVLDNFADLSNAGVSFIVLKPWDQRSKAKGTDILSIAERLQTGLNAAPDGRRFVLAPPPIQGIGNAGGVQMQLELLGGSFDYQRLSGVAQQMVKSAEADPQLQHVLTTFSPGAPHVSVTVDRDRAETLRVSVGDVFSVLSSYLGSTYVNQFNKFGLTLQVYVQADSQFRLQPDDLLNLYVRSSDNQMVPIGAVAHLGSQVGPSLVTLYNLYPSATIIGAPARGVSSGQALATMEDIAKKTLPSDVGYQWTAMSYQEKLTGNQLYYLFGLSVLLVYLCLAGNTRAGFCHWRCCRQCP